MWSFQITHPVSEDPKYLQLNKKKNRKASKVFAPFLHECLNDQLSMQGTVLMETCHFSPPCCDSSLRLSPVAASMNVFEEKDTIGTKGGKKCERTRTPYSSLSHFHDPQLVTWQDSTNGRPTVKSPFDIFPGFLQASFLTHCIGQ